MSQLKKILLCLVSLAITCSALAEEGVHLNEGFQIKLVDIVSINHQVQMVVELTNQSDQNVSISTGKVQNYADDSHFALLDGKDIPNFSLTPIPPDETKHPVVNIPSGGRLVLIVSPPASSILAEFDINTRIRLASELIHSNAIFHITRKNGGMITISRQKSEPLAPKVNGTGK